jgi:uncharacterized membrane protein YeaQ/YmgE (transglycosylase-associated protein family)
VNRKGSFAFSEWVYRQRNLVERFFNRIKQFRGIATRYDKDPDNFLAAIKLIAARISCQSLSVDAPRRLTPRYKAWRLQTREPIQSPNVLEWHLNRARRENFVGIIWTIIIGFLAGVIAKFLMPGKNEPSGFVLTTILGIVGAFVATFLGQSLGWYGPNDGAGLIGAAFGAILVLAAWGFIARRA